MLSEMFKHAAIFTTGALVNIEMSVVELLQFGDLHFSSCLLEPDTVIMITECGDYDLQVVNNSSS